MSFGVKLLEFCKELQKELCFQSVFKSIKYVK